MDGGYRDLARHNAWANARLLAFCKTLDPSLLDATAPGTFGSVLATLQHVIGSEASYIRRLTGAWPTHPWPSDAVDLDALAERAAMLGEVLERFLMAGWDSERLGEARGDEGEVFAVRASIFLTQLLHHGNEHRAHVCTILGARGHEPPDLSAWAYADDTGRSWLTNTPPDRRAHESPG